MIPPIEPYGPPEAAGASPWSSIAAGALLSGGFFGMLGGLGRKPKEPETKREKAAAALDELSCLYDDLESMTVDANCLLGSEAQGTTSPFNAETNALVGEIVLLRRRVLLTKARLHAFSIPKVRESLQKIAKEVEEAEAEVATILLMPDLTPEAEAAIKEASRDKSLTVQALSLPGAPHGLSVVADKAGISLERAHAALEALVAENLVARSATGFEWIGRRGPADREDAPAAKTDEQPKAEKPKKARKRRRRGGKKS